MKIELVRHGESWRYISDDGRISRIYPCPGCGRNGSACDCPADMYEGCTRSVSGDQLEFAEPPEWLAGLHAVCERLRYERDDCLVTAQAAAGTGSERACDMRLGAALRFLKYAEAEYARELARCSACGGKGWSQIEIGTSGGTAKRRCGVCHGTGKAAAEREA